jgi:hypothetical protein
MSFPSTYTLRLPVNDHAGETVPVADPRLGAQVAGGFGLSKDQLL